MDYRLSVAVSGGQNPHLDVEMRWRGDEDGETRVLLPGAAAAGQLSGFQVKGAQAGDDGPAGRVLRHSPRAKIVLRYRIDGSTGTAVSDARIAVDRLAVVGDAVFARVEGRDAERATFRWGSHPRGWTVASSLPTGKDGQRLSVRDLQASVTLAGPGLILTEPQAGGGGLRVAAFGGAGSEAVKVADEAAKALAAARGYWGEGGSPFLVAAAGLPNANGAAVRPGGVLFWSTPSQVGRQVALGVTSGWIPDRLGRPRDAGPTIWLETGLAGFVADRIQLRADPGSPGHMVQQLSALLSADDEARLRPGPAPSARSAITGALLALKWDDDIRRRSNGRTDLDDVLLRMRDHAGQFPAGQAPDLVTGLVSAAWVTARVDLLPDIIRHVDQGQAVSLPETLMNGCLETRVFTRPSFDSGFDHAASMAGRKIVGVRRGGPAWNSGLRNGMTLTAWKLTPGDTAREVELTVTAPGRRVGARAYRYWPYGDAEVLSTRSLALKPGLEGPALTACGRKLAGA